MLKINPLPQLEAVHLCRYLLLVFLMVRQQSSPVSLTVRLPKAYSLEYPLALIRRVHYQGLHRARHLKIHSLVFPQALLKAHLRDFLLVLVLGRAHSLGHQLVLVLQSHSQEAPLALYRSLVIQQFLVLEVHSPLASYRSLVIRQFLALEVHSLVAQLPLVLEDRLLVLLLTLHKAHSLLELHLAQVLKAPSTHRHSARVLAAHSLALALVERHVLF